MIFRIFSVLLFDLFLILVGLYGSKNAGVESPKNHGDYGRLQESPGLSLSSETERSTRRTLPLIIHSVSLACSVVKINSSFGPCLF